MDIGGRNPSQHPHKTPKSIDNLSSDQLYAKYGPYYKAIKRFDNQPLLEGVPYHGIASHGIGSVWLEKESEASSSPYQKLE